MAFAGLRCAGIAVFALAASFNEGAAAAGMGDELAQFRANRPAFALSLTEPIAACVVKRDTEHSVFHGCVDWHSAVHGVWALSAYTWITGDRRYQTSVQTLLSADAIAQERAYLSANPDFEMPYGRAWFLRLAIDHERAFGGTALRGIADDVAESLIAHYTQNEPDPKSTAYGSATWALINLYDFGAWRKDQRVLAFVREKVRAFYLSNTACPLQSVEVDTREFMAVCTNWAWLVGKVLQREEFKSWLAHFLPADLKLDPIEGAASVHQVGLNFSRTWGLWNLYRMTDDPRFLKAYLSHFKSTFERPNAWKGDYRTLSHWVAQFGMLGLVVSYYDDAQWRDPGSGP